jgi:hypothetical protein
LRQVFGEIHGALQVVALRNQYTCEAQLYPEPGD